jgi:hypothetical protein
MGLRNRLEDVYLRIPTLKCKGLCQDVCGPVPATTGEVRLMTRMAARPYGWQLATGHCNFLDESTGRCACYRNRPLLCRAWGTVEGLRCPFGCEPASWITQAEFARLSTRVEEVGGALVTPDAYVGDRPASRDEQHTATELADRLIRRGMRLPDRWDAAMPYAICPACQWRVQTEEPADLESFIGDRCPHCPDGVLRLAGPGDTPLFVSGQM